MSRAPRPTRPASDASQWMLRDRSGAAQADGGPAGTDTSEALDPQSLIDTFTASLQDVEMDEGQRQQFGAQFEQAIRDAAANPKADTALERSDWLQAVDVLRQMGVVDENESNALVRQLDQAMQPLQRRNVQLAMEFSRRCEQDGEEQALEWFRAQTLTEGGASSEAPGHSTRSDLPQGDTILNSRSRRLRGPPAR